MLGVSSTALVQRRKGFPMGIPRYLPIIKVVFSRFVQIKTIWTAEKLFGNLLSSIPMNTPYGPARSNMYPYDFCPKMAELPRSQMRVTPPKPSEWQIAPDELRKK